MCAAGLLNRQYWDSLMPMTGALSWTGENVDPHQLLLKGRERELQEWLSTGAPKLWDLMLNDLRWS